MLGQFTKDLWLPDRALTFGAATSDLVGFGNPGNVTENDIQAMGAWIRPTTLTSNRNIGSKNFSDGGGGFNMRLLGTGGDFQCKMNKSVADAIGTSNTTPLSTTGKWYCVFGIYDPADTQPRVYVGDLTTAIAEVGGYSVATQGSGTCTSTADLRAGNQGSSAAPVLAFQGDIGPFLWMTGLRPNVEMMRWWQFNPFARLPNTKASALLGDENGNTAAGAVKDLSLNGNDGTITGAKLVPGPASHAYLVKPPFPYRKAKAAPPFSSQIQTTAPWLNLR